MKFFALTCLLLSATSAFADTATTDQAKSYNCTVTSADGASNYLAEGNVYAENAVQAVGLYKQKIDLYLLVGTNQYLASVVKNHPDYKIRCGND